MEGVTTFRKFAISYTVERMIPLQLVIFHLTFTTKCLDRKFRNKAACQRSHSNERHIIHPLSKMFIISKQRGIKTQRTQAFGMWMKFLTEYFNGIVDPFNCKLDSRTQCQQKISTIGTLDISWFDQNKSFYNRKSLF